MSVVEVIKTALVVGAPNYYTILQWSLDYNIVTAHHSD